jgi:dTDP-4-amino-4,6-dideoxygalactose transaminase
MIVPFHKPFLVGDEESYISEVIKNEHFSGDGPFTESSITELKNIIKSNYVHLTPSCTASLELVALSENFEKGDEVIMPSYTFVSTANAFLLRGMKIKFVDIEPETMNVNSSLIENAITSKTKAIVVVHYGGVSCDMDSINHICKKHNLILIEDAAQCVNSYYKERHLGTIGDYGCFSFHSTKNLHCGEGGAISFNSSKDFKRATIIREKGTNRSEFIDGLIDKYTWKSIGSSFLPSEFQTAILHTQLKNVVDITNKRLEIWNKYNLILDNNNFFEIQKIPSYARPNGHIFFIKTANKIERSNLIKFLSENGIGTAFHYIPLHSTQFGNINCEFIGEDKYTTKDSERLLRLPIHGNLSNNNIDYVCSKIFEFYKKKI